MSPGAVLVQGFPADDTLDRLREALRHALRDHALAEGVDARSRRRPFGTSDVRSVSLVRTDWYMSRGVTATVKRYRS